MSPEQRQINELKEQVAILQQQMRQFLNQAELDPQIVRTIKISADAASVLSSGDTSGTLKTVAEAGASTYSVADAYDGTITVVDTDNNQYKLGYYTV